MVTDNELVSDCRDNANFLQAEDVTVFCKICNRGRLEWMGAGRGGTSCIERADSEGSIKYFAGSLGVLRLREVNVWDGWRGRERRGGARI